MTAAASAVRLLDLEPAPDDFLGEVLAGLRSQPKHIPSKFFYDERGSVLFDEICTLEEYYLTRTEIGILEAKIDEITAAAGPRVLLIEYGSGSSVKTRILLDHLEDLVAYVPIDISREHLLATARNLAELYPQIEILPVCADYTTVFELPQPSRPSQRRVAFFPGSTIGNFTPARALEFLHGVARRIRVGGGLLLGFDLKKDPAVLDRAYNDSQGVTAAFNLNLLERINRELGADFRLEAFRHVAFYNEAAGRIEMHLESLSEQTVVVGGEVFEFARGERIHTENSYKFSCEEMGELAGRAGLTVERQWTDSQKRFCLQFLVARG